MEKHCLKTYKQENNIMLVEKTSTVFFYASIQPKEIDTLLENQYPQSREESLRYVTNEIADQIFEANKLQEELGDVPRTVANSRGTYTFNSEFVTNRNLLQKLERLKTLEETLSAHLQQYRKDFAEQKKAEDSFSGAGYCTIL